MSRTAKLARIAVTAVRENNLMLILPLCVRITGYQNLPFVKQLNDLILQFRAVCSEVMPAKREWQVLERMRELSSCLYGNDGQNQSYGALGNLISDRRN